MSGRDRAVSSSGTENVGVPNTSNMQGTSTGGSEGVLQVAAAARTLQPRYS